MEMIGVRGRTWALRLGRLREGRGAPHAGRGELVVGDDCCGDIILNWRSERMMVRSREFRPGAERQSQCFASLIAMFRQKLHINFQLA
jgi:hypothetical protein